MSKKKNKPKTNTNHKIENRRARFDYLINEPLICGIELSGGETKQLRFGHGQLTGAYVTIKNNELYLINALITGTGKIPIKEESTSRNRKLLANKREIKRLIQAKEQGKTIIPLEFLTHGRFIKIKIAIATGKKSYDKRQSLKKRDEQKQIELNLKKLNKTKY